MLNSAIGGGNPGCLIKPATLVLLTPSTAINSVSPSTGGSFRLATPGRSGSMTRHLRDRVASGPPAAAYCTTSTVGEAYSAPGQVITALSVQLLKATPWRSSAGR